MNVLLEEKDFLFDHDCEELIRLFEENLDKIEDSKNGAQILRVRYLELSEFIKRVVGKTYGKCLNINPNVLIDTVDIYKWPTGSSMPFHMDKGDELASIIYLNDDYQGGYTVVEDREIKPEMGKLVIFSSSDMMHGVSEITGTRYTLAMWYVLKGDKSEV